MRLVKTRGTGPELVVASLLRASGIRYRSNCAGLPGTPDFVLPDDGAVIFVHGCFWHGCPRCFRAPGRNRAWWLRKIEANRRRDRRNERRLRRAGWRVMTVREHDQTPRTARRLSTFLGGARGGRRRSGKSGRPRGG